MRRSVPIIAAALLLNGGGLSLAQTGAAPGMAAAVPSATHARPSPPAFAGATALGTIPQGLGTSAAVGGSAAGNITPCATTDAGGGGSTANAPTQATSAFGTSTISGSCNPSQFPDPAAGGITPPPPAGAITAGDYSDGSVPLSSTEDGPPGLSPGIAVPPPPMPSPSCNEGSGAAAGPSAPGC